MIGSPPSQLLKDTHVSGRWITIDWSSYPARPDLVVWDCRLFLGWRDNDLHVQTNAILHLLFPNGTVSDEVEVEKGELLQWFEDVQRSPDCPLRVVRYSVVYTSTNRNGTMRLWW